VFGIGKFFDDGLAFVGKTQVYQSGVTNNIVKVGYLLLRKIFPSKKRSSFLFKASVAKRKVLSR
jgi:hypothetical protein